MRNKVSKRTYINGSSIYEETVTERYIGDLNIEDYKKHIEKENTSLTEFKVFNTPHTKLFFDSQENAIAVNRIEGIQFLAEAKPTEGMFKPYKVGITNSNVNYPLYNFITTPPDGAKMWALSYYRNGSIQNIKIVISIKYKNDTEYKIHRAPIPNLSFPEANLCMGNALRGKDEKLDIHKTPEKIQTIMRSGWNTDWHKNEVYFVEKDENNMKIRWHAPIIQIGECVLINDAKVKSIINRLENETSHDNRIRITYLEPDKQDYEQIRQNRANRNTANETQQENTENGTTEQTPVQDIPEPNQEVQNGTTPNNTETETNETTFDVTAVRPPELPPIPELPPVPETIDLRGDQQ